MKILTEKRCVIGEGPIWNEKENALYFTNGMEKEICRYDLAAEKITVLQTDVSVAAIAFDADNNMIASSLEGIFILKRDGTTEEFLNTAKYGIKYGNDMKVGPDGRLYIGTQSSKRMNGFGETDGRLYCIDRNGTVKILLNNMVLSNGMEWSRSGKLFYHTDNGAEIQAIKEYYFDAENGEIEFTGRQLIIPGVDGFTADNEDNLCVTCWGSGKIVFVNTEKMQIAEEYPLPCRAPSSCGFIGKNSDTLAITTSSLDGTACDENAGFTILLPHAAGGRKPYLFGREKLSDK